MVGDLAGHACDRRVRMKSAGATPVARHRLPVLSGIRRRAARGPMPSPTLFERIPPAARDIARWPFFLRPTSGSAGYPLADGGGKTGGSLADRRCMLSGQVPEVEIPQVVVACFLSRTHICQALYSMRAGYERRLAEANANRNTHFSVCHFRGMTSSEDSHLPHFEM